MQSTLFPWDKYLSNLLLFCLYLYKNRYSTIREQEEYQLRRRVVAIPWYLMFTCRTVTTLSLRGSLGRALHDVFQMPKHDAPWKPHNSRCHTHKSVISNLVQWPAAALGSNITPALHLTEFYSSPSSIILGSTARVWTRARCSTRDSHCPRCLL